MRRTAVLAVGGWVAAAVAATAAGVAAVTVIGRGLVGPPDEPLTEDQVLSALDGRTPAPTPDEPARPTATAIPAPTTDQTTGPTTGQLGGPTPRPGSSQVFRSDGGTARAVCSGGRVTLTAWSPAPGYAVDEARTGPAHDVRVIFTRGGDREGRIEMRVECGAGGVPTLEVKED